MEPAKRSAETDPDDENPEENPSKRARLKEEINLEKNYEKVIHLIKQEFEREISGRQEQVHLIQQRLLKAKKTLHLLKYVVIKSFYDRKDLKVATSDESVLKYGNNSAETRTDAQSRIHPAVKKVIGKRPFNFDQSRIRNQPNIQREIKKEISEENLAVSEKVQEVYEEVIIKQEPTDLDVPNVEISTEAINSPIRNREKTKYQIIVGNISQWMPGGSVQNGSTHKWMVYVRGPKENPDISDIVKKVRFFLHPSYHPNDIVELEESPFHLSRRGWGEFPLRVQIHFQSSANKPVDVIHNLKLDRTHTGRQTLGGETIINVWLYNSTSEEQILRPELPLTSNRLTDLKSEERYSSVEDRETKISVVQEENRPSCSKYLTDESTVENFQNSRISIPVVKSKGTLKYFEDPGPIVGQNLGENSSVQEFCRIEEKSNLNVKTTTVVAIHKIPEEKNFGEAEEEKGREFLDITAFRGTEKNSNLAQSNEFFKGDIFSDAEQNCDKRHSFEKSKFLERISFDDTEKTSRGQNLSQKSKFPFIDTEKNSDTQNLSSCQSNEVSSGGTEKNLSPGSKFLDQASFSATNSDDENLPLNQSIFTDTEKDSPKQNSPQSGSFLERASFGPAEENPQGQNLSPTGISSEQISRSELSERIDGEEPSCSKNFREFSNFGAESSVPVDHMDYCNSSLTFSENSESKKPKTYFEFTSEADGNFQNNSEVIFVNSPDLNNDDLNLSNAVLNLNDSEVHLNDLVLNLNEESNLEVVTEIVYDNTHLGLPTENSRQKMSPKVRKRGKHVLMKNGRAFLIPKSRGQVSLLKSMFKRNLLNKCREEQRNSLLQSQKNGEVYDRNLVSLVDHCYTKVSGTDEEKREGGKEEENEWVIDREKYKVEVPVEKFSVSSAERVVYFLFKLLPLVTEKAKDVSYRCLYPYAASALEEFSTWNYAKRACAEWSRAKQIKRILTENKIADQEEWTVKIILMYGRSHAFTPLSTYEIFQKKNESGKTVPNNLLGIETTSSFTQFMPIEELMSKQKLSTKEEEDSLVDVENEILEEEVKIRSIENKRILCESDKNLVLPLTYIRKCAEEVDASLDCEEIEADLWHNSSEIVMLQAVKCLLEELVRKSWANRVIGQRGRNLETEIKRRDIYNILLSRPEFNIFLNTGLGKVVEL